MADAYIIDAVRTPRGRGKKDKGALSSIHPQELLAQALNALGDRTGVEKKEVEDVVVGCVTQTGDQGSCVGRAATLLAGWPYETTAVTLNRFCGSGAQAANFAAMGIMSGQQDLVIGGGVESMSRVPMGADGAGLDGGNPHLMKAVFQVPQGISADLIATIEGFSREELDAFAATSQQRAEAAQKDGRFAKSLVPVKDPDSGEVVLDKDEHPRAGTTAESLGGLNPSFMGLGMMELGPNGETLDQMALKRYPDVPEINHVHTAGNSSGIVDGAAAVLFASKEAVEKYGLKPRAKVRAVATHGSEPVIMLTAPTPASQRALAKAGMSADDIDLWEINEAFATVPMQTMRNLGVPHEKVNVNGGAIALGHPLGATGAILLGTLIDELERQDKQTGVVTLCIGGGMGIATVIERV